jgi:hypothetical protein
MKRLLLLACCLAVALPARAATDPFAEFRIPDHAWRSGSASFGFSASRSDRNTDEQSDRNDSQRSSLSGSLRAGWDSDALQYALGVSAHGLLEKNDRRTEIDAPPYQQRNDRDARTANEGWVLDGSLRTYPWKPPVGLGVSGTVQGAYLQNRSVFGYRRSQDYPEPLRQESDHTWIRHEYQTAAVASVSAGLGRVRDASVVYDVHLLEERLIEAGALARPLSAAARAKLAALYYVVPFYAAAHERPDRFAWREIERVLREDGALAEGGLDPYSVLRAREPAAPGGRTGRATRQRGWFIGPVGQFTTQHHISREEETVEDRTYVSDSLWSAAHGTWNRRLVSASDGLALGGTAEFHLPLGWRWQLDATTRATRPARAGERGLDVSNRASVSWFVADRWLASAALDQSRKYFRPRGAGEALEIDEWQTQAQASVAYYLEDRTSLALTLQQQQARSTYAPYEGRAFSRYSYVSLGISYRFLGRLEAPGLIEPVRHL